jgi:hypothetical protein
MKSVARKARSLVKDGKVEIDAIGRYMHGFVTGNKNKKYSVTVWRDGHYSCECEWFLYSPSVHLYLWEENVRIKPECSHALAVKLTDEYKSWIRMITMKGMDGKHVLRAVEPVEKITIKSREEKKAKQKTKKKRIIPEIRKKRDL